MLRRSLRLPARPRESFFLWGPRQTGKSSLLRASYPDATRVDLLTTDGIRVVIEAKATERARDDHLRGLRECRVDHPRVARRILVGLDARARRTEDGIEILPWREFARRLWQDDLLGR